MSRRKRNRQAGGNLSGGVSPQKAYSTRSVAQPVVSVLAGYSLLLAIGAILLYLPITHHPFINYDDAPYITDNPNIQEGLNIATVKWALTSIYNANWHPVTWLVHALDIQLYGLNAGGHHFTSLLFHALNGVLLFLLLALATGATLRSFLAAAIFVLHPLNVESVAWAAELKNLLCTFFVFLTIAAYAWYARRPGIARYVLVFLFFALGLMAKPMVITLPFVLLLLDFWPLCRVESLSQPSETLQLPQETVLRLVLEKLPLLVLSAASAWITIRAQTAGQATTMIHAPASLRIANAIVAYTQYIGTFLIPYHLAPFYPFPMQGLPAWQIVISAIVLGVISWIVLRYGRRYCFLITGWLWFLGTLVPVIGLLQVGAQARADRYLYIPMVGLLVMLVWGVAEIAEARKWSVPLRAAPALLLLLILFALCERQMSHWSSSYDLWTYTLAVTRDNATAEHNLSMDLIRSQRVDEVYPHLLHAIALDPTDMVSHLNLGNVYAFRGQQADALGEFLTVVQNSRDPKLLLPASVNAGTAYLKMGDLTNAEAAYRSALRISPDFPTAIEGLRAVEARRVATPSSD